MSNNAYKPLVSAVRAIRNTHLAELPPDERDAAKAIYDGRIEVLVGGQKQRTAALQKAKDGRHGTPTSMREDRRLAAIQTWIGAGESRDWGLADRLWKEVTMV
jgi:hypothetical protein